MSNLQAQLRLLDTTDIYKRMGRVVQVVGLTVESQGPNVSLGELCRIELPNGTLRPTVVVGFRENRIVLMPLGDLDGIGPGLRVAAEGRQLSVPVNIGLKGRVVDGLGSPIDGRGPLPTGEWRSLNAEPPDPLRRTRVTEPLPLGVRSIDALATCGRGQRLGIFGGSGVGKSTLLSMFARNTHADINVIALIGERGREVRDFIERDLGVEGLARSVVVVVTSDRPALMRVKGAMTASTIAEYFRDLGLNVLLMMDSVTRLCMAQREIGLAVGEPPTTRGYTPSVFSILPKVLERSGNSEHGSITGLFTVLVEGDDMNEPIADAVRSMLDGHINLSRDLAAEHHFPAVDVLNSHSRTFLDIATPKHRNDAARVRHHLAVYRNARDLIDVGAYVKGSNPEIDLAVKVKSQIDAFLKQEPEQSNSFDQTCTALHRLAAIT